MKKIYLSAVVALACLGLAVGAARCRAQDNLAADLETSPEGGTHAMVPQTIQLSAAKPEGVVKEPHYRYSPSYGVLTLGDAKNNRLFVVLDSAPLITNPRLYVDANGNGDLTDDPAISLTPVVPSANTGNGGAVEQSGSRAVKLSAVVPVVVHYNLPGRAGAVTSELRFTLWDGQLTVNREYARTGILKVNGSPYRIALIDQGVDARFNTFHHAADDPPRVTLLIDRNNDGQFDLQTEAFDTSKPVRLGGRQYQVTSIDARGTHITLESVNKGKTIRPSDLRDGGDIIPFETDTTRSKMVQFPDDYKERIVLLDFWAMWCPPCRAEIPNIVRVYNQYHRYGFDILGVSLDKAEQQHTLSVFTARYGMTWPQIYDGGYWKAEIAALYGINSIPNAFLVDGSTGKILAMGDELRGPGLAQIVAAALTNLRR